MVNTVISWVVFTLIVIYILGITFVFCFVKRGWEEKVKFIRSFKFGKWSALFLISIPLFVIGYMSNGKPVDDSIFRAFTSTFKLLTLSLDFDFVLTAQNIAFKVALYTCYVAVIINDIFIATSCFFQSAINWVRTRRFAHYKKEKCIIIGNNAKSLMIYDSCKHKKILVGFLQESEKHDLFLKKAVYRGCKDENKLLKYLEKEIRRYGKFLAKFNENSANHIIRTKKYENSKCIAKLFVYLFVLKRYEKCEVKLTKLISKIEKFQNVKKLARYIKRKESYEESIKMGKSLCRLRIIVNSLNDEVNIRITDLVSQMFKKLNNQAHQYSDELAVQLHESYLIDLESKYKKDLDKIKTKFSGDIKKQEETRTTISYKKTKEKFVENYNNYLAEKKSIEELNKNKHKWQRIKCTDAQNENLKSLWNSVVQLEVDKTWAPFATVNSNLIDKKWDKNQKKLSWAINNTDVYVFGTRKNQDNYQKFEQISCGCVHYKNVKKIIAEDFVTKYPLTTHLNSDHIDYKTGLIKPDVDVRVIMIGFGKTNQQLFFSLLSTCQFITKGNEALKIYPTQYYLFDRDETIQNKNMSTYGFRYKYEVCDHKNDFINNKYFVLPDFPILDQIQDKVNPQTKEVTNDHIKKLDIGNNKFFIEFKKALSNKKLGVNYVIVSLGNDYETTDVTAKLIERIKQWGYADNTYIYASISSNDVSKNKGLLSFKGFKHFTPFGNEKEIIYNYEVIVNDLYTSLAMKEDAIYNSAKNENGEGMGENLTLKVMDEMQDKHLSAWNTTSLYDKTSSLYSVLSIPHKLQLMGKKLVFPGDEQYKENKLSLSESFNEYAKYYHDDLKDSSKFIKFASINEKADSWSNVKETTFAPGIRFNLAWLEHERWNHYMMTSGYIPLSKDEMLQAESQKNIDIKGHGCLTTFEGLKELQTFLETELIPKVGYPIKEPGSGEYRKYDYHVLDSLPLLLHGVKCNIVDKK